MTIAAPVDVTAGGLYSDVVCGLSCRPFWSSKVWMRIWLVGFDEASRVRYS